MGECLLSFIVVLQTLLAKHITCVVSLLMCLCISSPLHRGDKQDLSQALLPGLQRPAPPRPWEPTRTGQSYESLPGDNHNRLHNGYNAGPPAHLTARANQLLKVNIDDMFQNLCFFLLLFFLCFLVM